jgi:hypothetical protein
MVPVRQAPKTFRGRIIETITQSCWCTLTYTDRFSEFAFDGGLWGRDYSIIIDKTHSYET